MGWKRERGKRREGERGEQSQNEHKSQRRTGKTLIEGTKLKPSCTTSSTTFWRAQKRMKKEREREEERERERERDRGRIILTTTFEATVAA